MDSLKKQARIAGLIYFVSAACGIFSIIYVPSVIVDTGDAATTVNNVKANESLFRVDILVDLVSLILFIFLVLALYYLFKEVNKRQAILMVALVLVNVAVAFASTLNKIAVMILISGADFLSAFGADQLNSLTYLILRFTGQEVQAIQIFWGLWLFPFGILTYKSRFIPRIFGILLLVTGFAYVFNTFMFFVLPEYQSTVSPLITLLVLGELPIIFWLLIMGAKEEQPKASTA
jgi:flagellar biogenesis protein FliO